VRPSRSAGETFRAGGVGVHGMPARPPGAEYRLLGEAGVFALAVTDEG